MTNGSGEQNWNLWAKHVLISIDELKKQHSESEDKLDANKDEFIKAVNNLELTIAKEIGALTSKITIMESKLTQRSTLIGAVAGFIPAASAFIWMLFKMKGLA